MFVSHRITISSTTLIHQVVFMCNTKSLDLEMYVTDPHIFYVVNLCITWIQYSNYDINPSNSLPDLKQNHWTMECGSLTHIHLMR